MLQHGSHATTYSKLRSAEAQKCRLAEAVVNIPAGLQRQYNLKYYFNIVIFIYNYKEAIYKHEKKKEGGISKREEKSRLNSARTFVYICMVTHAFCLRVKTR